MAKVNYQSIPAGLLEAYKRALQPDERFIIPTIKAKTVIMSLAKIAGLTRQSYLPAVSVIWKTFSTVQKAAWKTVDTHSRQHGWRTFLSDQCKRIKFGLVGEATPNEFHQDMVGQLKIVAPADELKIGQPHPGTYYVRRKVSGTKSQYEPIPVTEQLALPLKISLSYKSQLYAEGPDPYAIFYADVRRLYQGNNISQLLQIDLALLQDWENLEATLSSVVGEAVSYNLYLHLHDVSGTVLVDNIKAEHSGSNWVRDTFCKNIEQDFTRAYYQVPKNWAPVTMPSGSQFLSVYPT